MDHSKWPGTRDYHWHRIGKELGLKYDSCDWRQVCRLISDPGAWEWERRRLAHTTHTDTQRETGEHRKYRGNGKHKGKYWGTTMALTDARSCGVKANKRKGRVCVYVSWDSKQWFIIAQVLKDLNVILWLLRYVRCVYVGTISELV